MWWEIFLLFLYSVTPIAICKKCVLNQYTYWVYSDIALLLICFSFNVKNISVTKIELR